jgi:hypothetical protein
MSTTTPPAPTVTPGRMTVSQIETLLGRAVKDPVFAKNLHDDPEATLKAMNLAPHPDELAFFKSLSSTGFSAAATTLHSNDPGHYMAEC